MNPACARIVLVEGALVLPAGAPRRAELEAQGWMVTATSFGARLDVERIDRDRVSSLVARLDGIALVRELDQGDTDAVLALDAVTSKDYPGSVATRHAPLDRHSATPSGDRRGFGARTPAGYLVGMTFVDIDGVDAETDFTVVDRAWRGRGVGTAVKAASVLALLADGVLSMRTGGSAENAAIIASNEAVGYVRDEEWVTLMPPAP